MGTTIEFPTPPTPQPPEPFPPAAAGRRVDEKRMVTVSAKVSPDRRRYLMRRARAEETCISELLNRMITRDEIEQGLLGGLPVTGEQDPAVIELGKLLDLIPEVLRDQVIDSLERSLMTRATVRAADCLVNRRSA